MNIASAIKKMTVNKLKDFIFENYYERFVKESSYYSKKKKRLKRKTILLLATKSIEKIAGPSNAQ